MFIPPTKVTVSPLLVVIIFFFCYLKRVFSFSLDKYMTTITSLLCKMTMKKFRIIECSIMVPLCFRLRVKNSIDSYH